MLVQVPAGITTNAFGSRMAVLSSTGVPRRCAIIPVDSIDPVTLDVVVDFLELRARVLYHGAHLLCHLRIVRWLRYCRACRRDGGAKPVALDTSKAFDARCALSTPFEAR